MLDGVKYVSTRTLYCNVTELMRHIRKAVQKSINIYSTTESVLGIHLQYYTYDNYAPDG